MARVTIERDRAPEEVEASKLSRGELAVVREGAFAGHVVLMGAAPPVSDGEEQASEMWDLTDGDRWPGGWGMGLRVRRLPPGARVVLEQAG